MAFEHEDVLLWCIASRYHELIILHRLVPTRSQDELYQRLCEAHVIQPLDLDAMTSADDLDLILAVGDVDLHYCQEARRIKDGFRSKFARI